MSGFFKVPNAVADALLESDPDTFRLYCLIAFRAAYKRRPSGAGFMLEKGECDLTQNQMAAALGVSRKKIINGTSKLTSMGTLTVHQRGHKRNIVRLELAGVCGEHGTSEEHQRVQERNINGDINGTSTGTLSNTKTKTKTKTNEDNPPTPLEQNQSEEQEPPPKAKGKGKPKPLKDRMAQLDKSIQTEAFQAYWRTYQQQVRPSGAPNWRRTWCAWEDCNGEEHAEEIMAGLRAYAARVAAEAQDGRRFAYSAYRWLDERIWESMADAGAPNQAVSAVRWQSEPLSFE